MSFGRKLNLSKGRLTESSFYRKKSFGRKQNLSKDRLTENIWKTVISPKIKFEKLV
jgi:hypothetical protein